MAISNARRQRAARRRFPLAEKRRLVELTLREGASIRAIAREQGVNRNSLYQWQTLYCAGKLTAPAPRVPSTAPGATFLPVAIAAERTQRSPRSAAGTRGSSVVQLMLASGATLRIETDALDAGFICALISELQQ